MQTHDLEELKWHKQKQVFPDPAVPMTRSRKGEKSILCALQADWVQTLLGRVRENGRIFLLEDPEQQPYKDREGFELPEATTITSHENFRSPRALVKLINALHLTGTEIDALGPHAGELPDPIVFDSPEAIKPCTIQAIERCLARGFAVDDIAVISMRGRERSQLQRLDTLGKWTLRRFTGAFDAGGLTGLDRRRSIGGICAPLRGPSGSGRGADGV